VRNISLVCISTSVRNVRKNVYRNSTRRRTRMQPMIVPWQQKMNSLCVGIAGVGGLGQEELAEELSKFADLPLIPDGVKGYMENNRLIRNTMGNRQIFKMYMNVLAEKKAIERAALKFVSVGTTLDYVSDLLTEMASDTSLNDMLNGFMQEAGMHAVEVYDVILLMPYKRLGQGDDIRRSAEHMLTTQGAMEAQPICLLHPLQSETLNDLTAEGLEVIEKVITVKSKVYAKQQGKDIPTNVRTN
jgi:hypothetical protein